MADIMAFGRVRAALLRVYAVTQGQDHGPITRTHIWINVQTKIVPLQNKMHWYLLQTKKKNPCFCGILAETMGSIVNFYEEDDVSVYCILNRETRESGLCSMCWECICVKK